MTRYAKALAALLTALGTWGATAGSDGDYSHVELWGLCGVAVTALAVLAIPNRPPDGDPHRADYSEQDPDVVPDAGHVDAVGLLVVLLVVALFLTLLGLL